MTSGSLKLIDLELILRRAPRVFRLGTLDDVYVVGDTKLLGLVDPGRFVPLAYRFASSARRTRVDS